MTEESVKVAVRCRPFNQREKDRGAKLIIKMNGQVTTIENPEESGESPKSFSFDHSYWSHDGFIEKPDGLFVPDSSNSNYASQQKVFDDLGAGVLKNAFEGFNCSLFAYGQTGSGKSYSMIGYGVNKGIVPITCEGLFGKISKNQEKFEVTFSMLEIYNEQVNDLLNKNNQKGGLQVRQHPSQGYFYAQDLKRIPVDSYKEIERRIEEGTANRTVASTHMNATSSRAHTIVTITFDQILNLTGGESKKSSVINLVDLAGSERADSTGATGDRLKEGANINKSLSALGNVISALAEISMSSKKKIVVPYRDSVLTKLLQNALGGNSKTIMIAALSPADINYSETLSTLRYADRAKRIKTKAVVNENPTDKLIRQLKEENDKLKSMIESGKISMNIDQKPGTSYTKEEIEELKRKMFEEIKAQMEVNQQMIKDTKLSFKERLEMAKLETASESKESQLKEERKHKIPYLTNLNEDPILSYVICHFLGDKETKIGRTEHSNIKLTGLEILNEHAVVYNLNNNFTLSVCQIGAKVKVNGINVKQQIELNHNDRILFGLTNLYVFINPTKADAKEKQITWEQAQKEIAEVKGYSTKNSTLSKEQKLIQEEIIELLPTVAEVNAISDELNKHRLFEIIIVPLIAFEDYNPKSSNGQKVMIKMTNLQTMNVWLWDKGKLMNRKYLMQDLYQRYLEGEDFLLRMKKEEDPFWEPAEDLFIGLSNFFLQSLSYSMDFEDNAYISDYKGFEIGTMSIKIAPCLQDGKTLGEDAYTDDPNTLLNKPFCFSINISKCEINDFDNVKGFKIKFKVFGDKIETVETPIAKNENEIKFNFTYIVRYNSLKNEHLSFFESGSITFLFFAIQKESSPKSNISCLSTRELKILRQNENRVHNLEEELIHRHGHDIDPTHIKLELSLLQRKFDLLEEKEAMLQKLCNIYLKKTLNKETQEFLNEVIKIINKKPKK